MASRSGAGGQQEATSVLWGQSIVSIRDLGADAPLRPEQLPARLCAQGPPQPPPGHHKAGWTQSTASSRQDAPRSELPPYREIAGRPLGCLKGRSIPWAPLFQCPEQICLLPPPVPISPSTRYPSLIPAPLEGRSPPNRAGRGTPPFFSYLRHRSFTVPLQTRAHPRSFLTARPPPASHPLTVQLQDAGGDALDMQKIIERVEALQFL